MQVIAGHAVGHLRGCARLAPTKQAGQDSDGWMDEVFCGNVSLRAVTMLCF